MLSLFIARSGAHKGIYPGFLAQAGAITLAVVYSAAAFAADGPLTLAAAQKLAVERSLQLPAQDMAIIASREMAVAAGQLPDPTLKIGLDNLPVNGSARFSATDDFMTMRRIGVGQEWTHADKRQLRSQRYEREADKSVAEKAVVIAAIERDTALAWLDRYYAEQMAAVIAEQAAQAQLEIEAAESAYRGGRGNQADIFSARSELVEVKDRLSEIQRRARNARTMLMRWVGDAPDVPLAEVPNVESLRLNPAALDTQLAHHPQIAVLSRQVSIAESEAKLAEANKQADWSVELAFQQRGPAYSNMVSIGISLPLQWDQKNRQDRELSAKLAALEQSKAERDEMLREHVAETRIMIEEWQNDRERSARYAQELIPLVNQRVQAVVTAYRGGKASLADVLLARRSEIDIRLQALQMQADTARIWAQLNFLFPTDEEAMHSKVEMDKDRQ
jgi:outer membrane protein TolC